MTRPTPPAPPATGDAQVDAVMADQQQLEADNAAAGNPTPGSDAGPAAAGEPAPPALNATQAAMLNEDWLKLPAWDVTHPDGTPVTTLDALVEVLGAEDRHAAALELLATPAAAAAPAELLAEAKAEVNPDPNQQSLFDEIPAGEDPPAAEDPPADVAADPETQDEADQATDAEDDDDKPAFLKKGANPFAKGPGGKGPDTGSSTRKETIAAGAFVSGPFGKGKVEVVVTSGKVPGIDTDVEGTKSAPAVRIRVYEETDGEWKASDKKVGAKVSALKTIPPLGAAKFGKKSGAAGLVLLTANAAHLPEGERPTAEAIRSAYTRGLNAWPGEAKTLLPAAEWALGRAEAFVQKCQGIDTPGYVGDDDLLP